MRNELLLEISDQEGAVDISQLIKYHFVDKLSVGKKSKIIGVLKYSAILLDCVCASWLYVSPSIKMGGDSILKKIVLLSGSLGANFGLIFWASNSALNHVEHAIRRGKLHKAPEYGRNKLAKVATIMAKTGWVSIAGFFPSVLPMSAAFQESKGLIVSVSFEAIAVLAADLPLNMYGSLDVLKEITDILPLCFRAQKCEEILLKELLLSKLDVVRKNLISKKVFTYFENVSNPQEILRVLLKTGTIDKQKNKYSCVDNKIMKIIRVIWGLFGTLLAETELTGYVYSSEKFVRSHVTDNLMGSWTITAAVAAIPIYLSATVGYKVFSKIWDYSFGVVSRNTNRSLAYSLYSKTTICLMTLALLLATFSFSTSVQLVRDNYSAPVASILQWFAAISTIMFNGYGSFGAIDSLITSIAMHFGSDEKRKIAGINAAISGLMDDIDGMDAITLKNFFARLPMFNESLQCESSALLEEEHLISCSQKVVACGSYTGCTKYGLFGTQKQEVKTEHSINTKPFTTHSRCTIL